MTAHRTNVDQQPESEFVRKAKELLNQRLSAKAHAERRALEIELGALLAAHRVRSAWAAVEDAEAVEQAPYVPRDTSSDRSCHGETQPANVERDRKLASVGPESD